MFVLSRLVRDGEEHEKPKGNYILVELVAAQVVAKAAYDGVRFRSLSEIKAAVLNVAGYPMHNRISVSLTGLDTNVDIEAAYRVAWLTGLSVESQASPHFPAESGA
jgi:hypothetical protein